MLDMKLPIQGVLPRPGVGVDWHEREMGVVERWQLGMLGGGCQIEKSIFLLGD